MKIKPIEQSVASGLVGGRFGCEPEPERVELPVPTKH